MKAVGLDGGVVEVGQWFDFSCNSTFSVTSFRPFRRSAFTGLEISRYGYSGSRTLRICRRGYLSPTKRGRGRQNPMVRRRAGADSAVRRAWPTCGLNAPILISQNGASASAPVQLFPETVAVQTLCFCRPRRFVRRTQWICRRGYMNPTKRGRGRQNPMVMAHRLVFANCGNF